MKKTRTIITAVLLILSMVCTAFAENSSYTKSPVVQDVPVIKKIEVIAEGEDAPEIVVVKNQDGVVQFYTKDEGGPAEDNCLVSLKVTPYAEKSTIAERMCKVTDGTSVTGEVSAEERLDYAKSNSKNGTDGMGADNFKLWREVLSEAAEEGFSGAADAQAKIKNKDLAIVSVFDVSVWCENPEIHDLSQNHCIHTIRIDFGDSEMSSLLNRFVALMHYNRAGEWEYIPSTLFEDTATHSNVIEFTMDCNNLSPFAIAAYSSSSEGAPISPQTGEAFPVFTVCAAALCLGLGAYFVIKRKKA